jgi:type II secretory pathway component PulJ
MNAPVAQASRLPVLSVSTLPAHHGRAARGFTVLEIVVASSIALFVFAVGYLALHTATRTSDETTKRIRDTENARMLFNMLERDLATAFPGPGNLLKKRETLSQQSAYSHNANSDPSPLVLTETVNPSTPTSDVIQFYCRNDVPGVRDEIVLVRYYVNRKDHTLCRKAVVYDPLAPATPGHEFPDYEDPKGTLTNADNSDQALFDNLRQMTVTFQQWRPELKHYATGVQMIPPASDAPPDTYYPGSDSMLVTLIFTDDFKEKRVGALINKDSNYQSKIEKTYRSYAKVFSIPATFKQ